MNRQKYYPRLSVSDVGWRLIINRAIEIAATEVRRVDGRSAKNGGDWGYENLQDFLSDLNPTDATLHIHFKNEAGLKVSHVNHFNWDFEHPEKAAIVKLEHEIEDILRQHSFTRPEVHRKSTVVFVGHGRSADWRDLKDHLVDMHKIRVEAYETGSRAGHSIRDVLEDMLDVSSLAILVHTPEDELADGSFNSRPNVIHETGLFQGKLGFSRAVVLKKHGTEEFSNLAGIQQIRYQNIRETFGDVLAWIKREEGA